MNPQFDSTPGLNLPEPSLNAKPVVPVVPSQATQPYAQPQQPVAPQAIEPQPQMVPVQPALPVEPTPVAPQNVTQQQAQSLEPAAQQAAPLTEDDIDQQWINKAKSAVTQFQMDPYAQSNAISRIKAEYLQTRHNITTKLGGDS